MQTRTSENWVCLPGNFDKHNLFELHNSSNEYGIPELRLETEVELPKGLVPYTHLIRTQDGYKDLAMHFFLDDYRFETTWSLPDQTYQRVKRAEIALTPDFSLYSNMPRAIQIYNTYKSRWVGKFWQNRGMIVIPTVSWGEVDTFDFCFLGIPETSPVAVSTVGINAENIDLFLAGYYTMLGIIKPRFVICYGKVLPQMQDSQTVIKSYPTSYKNLRDLRRKSYGTDVE